LWGHSPAPDQHSEDVPLNRYPKKNNEIKSNTGASGLRNLTNQQLDNLGYYTIQTHNPKSPELFCTITSVTILYSSQQPLKRFQLLTQDMMEHSSAAAVTVLNTVDTDLIAYFADCNN